MTIALDTIADMRVKLTAAESLIRDRDAALTRAAELMRGYERERDEARAELMTVKAWSKALDISSRANFKSLMAACDERDAANRALGAEVAKTQECVKALQRAKIGRCCNESGCHRPCDFDVDQHNEEIDVALAKVKEGA